MLCRKCKKPIPKSIYVNGKQRNLQNRKYCLECSPFGEHNTRPLDEETILKNCANTNRTSIKNFGDTCLCIECGKLYIKTKTNNRSNDVCSSCMTNRQRFRKKKELIIYLGGKCEICGYNKCIKALQFHHKDPKEKEFQIAGNHTRAWDYLLEEAKKCHLLCSNCHTEVHAGLHPEYMINNLEKSNG